MLFAFPYERMRACSVCPIDCPMHAAHRTAGAIGCHHGGTMPAPADDGACAMRSACGHRGGATEIVFQAVLAPVTTVHAVGVATRSWVGVPRPHQGEAPAPLDHPPESVRV